MTAIVKMKKSETINDSLANGGEMTGVDVLNNTGQNIFPNVTESDRTAGLTRHRKVFLKKEDGVLDNGKFFIDKLSTSGDYFRLKAGTDTDVQSDATGYSNWAGAGEITEALTGGTSTTVVAMYDNPDGANAGSVIALVDWDNLVSGVPTIEYANVETAAFSMGEGGVHDDDCSDLAGWTDDDNNGASTQEAFEGRDCFKFTVATAGTGRMAQRSQDVGTIADSFSVEIRLYHNLIGTRANNDDFALFVDNGTIDLRVRFSSDGLMIYDGAAWNEVGTNIVSQDDWVVWRFVVDGSTAGSEIVNVYKNGSLVGSDVDCSFAGSTDGNVILRQRGYSTNSVLSYVDYLKISDGAATDSNECYLALVSPVVSNRSIKTKATIAGTADETFDVDGLTLVVSIDGGAEQTITLSGNGQTAAQVASQIDAGLSGATAMVTGSTKVAIESDLYYASGSVQIMTSSTADTELGFDNSIHYGTDGTIVSEVLELGSFESSHTTPDTSGSSSGTFNDSGYPIETFDAGTISDSWSVDFSSPTEFDVTGSSVGLIGTGDINADFQVANLGSCYFKITKEEWGGTWASGDSMTFSTVHSAKGIWIKEHVTAMIPAYIGNKVSFTLDGETF
jgi:hypothetical protein